MDVQLYFWGCSPLPLFLWWMVIVYNLPCSPLFPPHSPIITHIYFVFLLFHVSMGGVVLFSFVFVFLVTYINWVILYCFSCSFYCRGGWLFLVDLLLLSSLFCGSTVDNKGYYMECSLFLSPHLLLNCIIIRGTTWNVVCLY